MIDVNVGISVRFGRDKELVNGKKDKVARVELN